MPKDCRLRRELRHHDTELAKTQRLADALGVSKYQTSRWLNGRGFSVETAKKIAEIIGKEWPVVYSWQDGH
jgi:transcriptional regulator with XRE-family HTH domain